jgi:hypothetical protein
MNKIGVGAMSDKEINEIHQTVEVPYKWSYGRYWTRFFREIKENQKIYGSRCTKCKGVLVPPVRGCGKCYALTEDEWVEVPDKGTVVSYTVVHLPFPGQPTEPPYAYTHIRLDGTDTDFIHILGEIDFDKIKIGMRVQAVWKDKEERKGDLLDIKYFKPIEEE